MRNPSAATKNILGFASQHPIYDQLLSFNYCICHSLVERDVISNAFSYMNSGIGSNSGGGWEFFSSTPLPDRLWGPPSFLSNGYQGLFLSRGKAAGAWSWQLTSI